MSPTVISTLTTSMFVGGPDSADDVVTNTVSDVGEVGAGVRRHRDGDRYGRFVDFGDVDTVCAIAN